MKLLVVGSGGREHALCAAIRKSPLCTKLFCTPGNAGIAQIAEILPIPVDDIASLVAFSQKEAIDLVVVGPEVPLVMGLADQLDKVGIPAFGPSQAAAALEGSKGFMKDMVARCNIPTAEYQRFTDIDAAKDYIMTKGAPIVVKTDGLAAGKGVVVAMSLGEALAAVDSMMVDKIFGAAGNELVIEEFLDGEEASFFAIVDGVTALPLASAQDHKRVGDGDAGPNTGGMGAYSPTPVVTEEIESKIMQHCILPLVRGMAEGGTPYRGILFAGVMIKNGEPKLLEYNVRFGDPECQVLMARLKSDIVALFLSAVKGNLSSQTLHWSSESAITVVMAANGYPGNYRKGGVIDGTENAEAIEGVSVFHAGTRINAKGQLIADGGRVLGITATGTNLGQAQKRAYQAIDQIRWEDGFYRRDIAWRALR